ncbi:hypothetical protein E2C01_034270 [Portunus trituberculatus]|uniref:Uncharacterized protein n=1 Tax=Portunus trituberculatus TaxID=210409 RepID=A0A5B7F549_PORTR|nr:hypothetical protein [Portunus trituberculatus]
MAVHKINSRQTIYSDWNDLFEIIITALVLLMLGSRSRRLCRRWVWGFWHKHLFTVTAGFGGGGGSGDLKVPVCEDQVVSKLRACTANAIVPNLLLRPGVEVSPG